MLFGTPKWYSLPTRAANQPLFLKIWGKVTVAGSRSRRCGDIGVCALGFRVTPVASGRRPVSSDDRLGLHRGNWV